MLTSRVKQSTKKMMKAGLLSLGLLLAQPVWAEWVRVAGTKKYTAYIDPLAVRKTANGRRAWLMDSFEQPHTNKVNNVYQSLKRLHEYDCTGEQTENLAETG